MSTLYPNNLSCPCGSDKIYSECCKKINRIYLINEEGKVIRQPPNIPNEMNSIIDMNLQLFKEIFGRTPFPNDPLFFHLILFPKENTIENICEQLRLAGAPEEQVYATKMTGLIITDVNEHIFSEFEKEEWKNHSEQYSYHKQKGTLDQLLNIDRKKLKLISQYDKIKYILAITIEKINQRIRLNSVSLEDINKDTFLSFCLTKTLKTNKSISALMDSELNEDSFALIRSLYENYLQTILMKNNEYEYINILKAKKGIKEGTHQYEIRNGRINKRIIIKIETGERIQSNISNKAICELSEYEEDLHIYYFLYDFLSSYVHPDYRTLNSYIDHEGFDHVSRKYDFDVTIIAVFINLIYLKELCSESFIDETSIQDIEKYIRDTKPLLLPFLNTSINEIEIPQEMIDRINNINE